MVATWLTELLLDRVNRALLNQRDPEGAVQYAQVGGRAGRVGGVGRL